MIGHPRDLNDISLRKFLMKSSKNRVSDYYLTRDFRIDEFIQVATDGDWETMTLFLQRGFDVLRYDWTLNISAVEQLVIRNLKKAISTIIQYYDKNNYKPYTLLIKELFISATKYSRESIKRTCERELHHSKSLSHEEQRYLEEYVEMACGKRCKSDLLEEKDKTTAEIISGRDSKTILRLIEHSGNFELLVPFIYKIVETRSVETFTNIFELLAFTHQTKYMALRYAAAAAKGCLELIDSTLDLTNESNEVKAECLSACMIAAAQFGRTDIALIFYHRLITSDLPLELFLSEVATAAFYALDNGHIALAEKLVRLTPILYADLNCPYIVNKSRLSSYNHLYMCALFSNMRDKLFGLELLELLPEMKPFLYAWCKVFLTPGNITINAVCDYLVQHLQFKPQKSLGKELENEIWAFVTANKHRLCPNDARPSIEDLQFFRNARLEVLNYLNANTIKKGMLTFHDYNIDLVALAREVTTCNSLEDLLATLANFRKGFNSQYRQIIDNCVTMCDKNNIPKQITPSAPAQA